MYGSCKIDHTSEVFLHVIWSVVLNIAGKQVHLLWNLKNLMIMAWNSLLTYVRDFLAV